SGLSLDTRMRSEQFSAFVNVCLHRPVTGLVAVSGRGKAPTHLFGDLLMLHAVAIVPNGALDGFQRIAFGSATALIGVISYVNVSICPQHIAPCRVGHHHDRMFEGILTERLGKRQIRDYITADFIPLHSSGLEGSLKFVKQVD